MAVIPAVWKANVDGSQFKAQSEEFSRILLTLKKRMGMWLKAKALGLIPSTANKKPNRKPKEPFKYNGNYFLSFPYAYLLFDSFAG